MQFPRPSHPLAAIVVLLAVLFGGISLAAAETGPMSAETDHARIDALGLDADLHAAVTLRCHGQVADDGASVGCEWRRSHDRVSNDLDVRAWQLWKIQVAPETGHRTLVAEVGADTNAVRDTDVTAPAKYLYAVLGLNSSGEVVARSRVVAVRLGERPHRDIEHLRLECAGHDGDEGPIIGCDWTGVETAPAVEYRLFRQSEHNDRRVVTTTGLDQTSFRDESVDYGVRYRYWVIGVDGHGDIVAASRSAVAGVHRPDREIDREPVRDAVSDRVSDAASDQASDVVGDRVTDHAPDHRDRPADRPGDRPADRPRDQVSDRAGDRPRDH